MSDDIQILNYKTKVLVLHLHEIHSFVLTQVENRNSKDLIGVVEIPVWRSYSSVCLSSTAKILPYFILLRQDLTQKPWEKIREPIMTIWP